MKAFYFPEGHFLAASQGIHPSYYWRGLLWGRELLQTGLGWRVGTGEHINIRGDNWLPGTSNFKLIQPSSVPPHYTKMAGLINPNTHSWNKPIIQQICSPIDCERILNIPLPPICSQDKLAWLPSKDGLFSVKRAYWFAFIS